MIGKVTVTSEPAGDSLLECLIGMWEWQRGVQELLPDALCDKVRRALASEGVKLTELFLCPVCLLPNRRLAGRCCNRCEDET